MTRDLNFYLNQRYPIVLYPAEEGGYVAEIEELEGCITQGETPEEAVEMLNDARILWIESAIENGDPIPFSSRV
jgi:antitoxin HicB